MKVLMFGWEFPPHISGGLGTACAGLTRALEDEEVDVLFVVPKLQGGESGRTTFFINASSIPIEQNKPEFARVSGPEDASAAERPQEIPPVRGTRTQLEVPAMLTPYSASATTSGLQNWNYSFKRIDQRTIPASLRKTRTPEERSYTPGGGHLQAPYAFSGTYNNLMEEVHRYAQVGAAIAAEYSFDVIHAHDWMTYPAAAAASAVSGKPVIAHVHATEIDRSGFPGNPEVFRIEKQGMLQANKVVTVSAWTKQVAVKYYGVDPARIEVIHNGITLKPDTGERYFSAPVGAPIVTFLGRITYQKGPMFFVEAARLVHQQFPDAHFVVAGAGDQLPEMIERIAQVRLSTHFHFTGFLSGNDIDRVWSMSNVYVMPSVSEPFGLATLEAIQAGVPVILSKQAGVGEVMPDAIKVDFWNCEALAEAICNVLRYKSLANTMKKNGAERVKNITWTKAAKKLTRLYHELATDNSAEKSHSLLSGTPAPQVAHAPIL